MPNAVITEEGLLIPREELKGMGDVILERVGQRLVIRPKSMVEATRGIVSASPQVTDRLIDGIELGDLWESHDQQAE